jgi:NAD(P)-dependent dehydrogenase (short-subunit alcohol dehydrogenase family)
MNIVIIGGTRGIGFELVKIFLSDEKNKVVATGRNIDPLLKLKHGSLLAFNHDLAEFEVTEKIVHNSIKEFLQSVDILINNAGSIVVKDFDDFTADEARRLFEINFIGPASVIRTLKPLMKQGSHIINISSMGGYMGSSKYKGLSYYSASKAALACLSECLAKEYSSDGIHVNCLALGAVQTEMLQEAFPGYKAPVSAAEMAQFIADFATLTGKLINGKVIPVAISNP